MQTIDDQYTPRLDDLNFELSSSCIPSGQALFQGLANGDYLITITKSGFDNTEGDVSVVGDWQGFESTLYAP